MLMGREEVEKYISWDSEPGYIENYPVFLKAGHSVIDLESITVAGPVRRGGWLREFVRTRRATSPRTIENVERFRRELYTTWERPVVVVVGGGQIGLGASALYSAVDIDVIAFDIYGSPNVQFIADGHDVPIADGSVQGVVVQAVLEHVLDPAKVVAEIARILEPGGIVYAETPFMQHVHEGAYDFTRFSHSGHRWLFRGFECLSSGALTGPATYFVWAASALAAGLFRSRTAGRLTKVALHWVTYLDRLIPESLKIDGACAVYFLGRSVTEAITPTDAVAFYAGAQ